MKWGELREFIPGDSLKRIDTTSIYTEHISLSSDGNYWGVALSTDYKSVYLQDRNLPQNRIYLSRNINSLRDLAFAPAEKMFATASEDGSLRLWNYQGEEVFHIDLFSSALKQIFFSGDGESVICVDEIGKIAKLKLAPDSIYERLKE